MDKCDSHGVCKDGYIGVDYGSTYTSGSYAFPKEGVYDLGLIARITETASYLDIVQEATTSSPTVLRYPPADQVEPANNFMDAPKALLMDRSLRHGKTALEDIHHSWNGLKIPNDHYPSAVFLEGYCRKVLRRFWDMAGESKRPGIILTYPSGFSNGELGQFQKAVDAANIKQFACPTCGISYFKEGQAATLTALKDYVKVLREAHKRNEAIVIADYGGITDDIVTFRFDSSLGGGSTLPGTVVNTECHWTGARSAEHDFKVKILEAARVETGRQDSQFIEEIQKDIDKARRSWVNHEMRSLVELPITYPGFACNIGGFHVLVRREAIQRVMDQSAETKANILLAMIRAEAEPPKYLVLVGGFSKCEMLYKEVTDRLARKLRALDPPINMPQILEHLPGKDAQLAVSRGTVLFKIPGFLDQYAPTVDAAVNEPIFIND